MEQWIFFDIGSTLVDETECYNVRYKEMASGTNITFSDFENKVIEYATLDKKADHEVAKYYGLNIPKWHKELESPYPETISILEYLTSKGYSLGIIANQSFGTVERLENWDILKYFSIVLSSAEEGVSKPNPKIFLRALEKASITAENAFMVGDRIDNDIEPAQKLGMRTVWIKQGFAKYSKSTPSADFIINNLNELKTIF